MKKINYVIMDICRAQMYGLNPTETMLVAYLHRLLTYTPLYIDGEAWYSCDFTFIVDNCPVITDKEDTLRRLFRKIEDKGLITTLWLGTRRYFQPSDDLRNWGNSIDEEMIISDENIEEREKNPTDGKKIPPMGKKSHRWEKNPTDGKKIPSRKKNPVSLYNNNINNNNNLNNNSNNNNSNNNISSNNISSNNISSNNISNNNLLNNNNNNILLYNNINKENNKERNIKERKKKEIETSPLTDKDKNEDKSIKRLFRNSGIYVGEDYERLEQMFAGAEYQDIDIVYYYHAVADWSDSSNTKRTDRGWLATIRNFIRSDMERGKLHKKHDNDDIDPDLLNYLKM